VAILQTWDVLVYCTKQDMVLLQALKQSARVGLDELVVSASTAVLLGLK
jgi:hypothetical protein